MNCKFKTSFLALVFLFSLLFGFFYEVDNLLAQNQKEAFFNFPYPPGTIDKKLDYNKPFVHDPSENVVKTS